MGGRLKYVKTVEVFVNLRRVLSGRAASWIAVNKVLKRESLLSKSKNVAKVGLWSSVKRRDGMNLR